MPNQVRILGETREYDGFFKVDKAILQYEKYGGGMSEKITRLNLNRGDSVAVLLYDREKDSIILIEQFRYPAYLNNGPGWLLELVAGMMDNDRDADSVAKAELMEEAGYEVDSLTFLCKFYVSPGGSSEVVHLYLGNAHKKAGIGGGKDSEHEDIRIVELPLDNACEMVKSGEICDAKTIIAIQWLKIHKMAQSIMQD